MRIEIPDDYSSAYSGALYRLCDMLGASSVDVEIIDVDRGETLGIRRLRHLEDGLLNIAGYLSRALDPQPLPEMGMGWQLPVGRDVGVCLLSGDLLTDPCRFVASLEGLRECRLLSDLRHRSLAPGERDELSLLLPACHVEAQASVCGDVQRVVVAAADHGGGLLSLALDGSALVELLPADTEAVEMDVVVDGRPVASLCYLLGAPMSDGVRLGWLNRYGAVDYFTFRALQRHLVCDKESVMTPSGALTVSSRGSAEWLLSSGYLSCHDATAVAELLCSPRVWLMEGATATPHQITDHSVVVSRNDQLSELRFSLRSSQPVFYPTF